MQEQKPSLLLSDQSNRWKRFRSFVAYQLLARTANLVMLAVAAIFGFIIWRSLPFLTSGGFGRIGEMFSSGNWHPDAEPPEFGMLSLFYGFMERNC